LSGLSRFGTHGQAGCLGDNGASAEGTPNGCFNKVTTLNGMAGGNDVSPTTFPRDDDDEAGRQKRRGKDDEDEIDRGAGRQTGPLQDLQNCARDRHTDAAMVTIEVSATPAASPARCSRMQRHAAFDTLMATTAACLASIRRRRSNGGPRVHHLRRQARRPE
jgi:hypothetical protein